MPHTPKNRNNFRNRNFPLAFWVGVCYTFPIEHTQGWYIGITAASQAVKAGSTPVPCSIQKSVLVRGRIFVSLFTVRFHPTLMNNG